MMLSPVTVTLFGEPVAWARTRLGKGIHFTPTKQRNNAAVLRLAAQEAMAGRLPFDCPVRVELMAEFAVPGSWSSRKRLKAISGQLMPGKRPDIDNLYKIVADAFNTVVFRDDCLVVEAVLLKVYSGQPKLVVKIEPALPALPAQVAA